MASGTAFKDSTSFEKGLDFAKGNSMFHFEVIGPVPRPSSLQWSKAESEKSLAGGLCKNVVSLLRIGQHARNHRCSFKCQYTQTQFGCARSSLKYVDGKKRKKEKLLALIKGNWRVSKVAMIKFLVMYKADWTAGPLEHQMSIDSERKKESWDALLFTSKFHLVARHIWCIFLSVVAAAAASSQYCHRSYTEEIISSWKRWRYDELLLVASPTRQALIHYVDGESLGHASSTMLLPLKAGQTSEILWRKGGLLDLLEVTTRVE